MATLDQDLSILMRLLVAAFLSSLIGFERELTGKEAGLRTHMLVAIGSALAISLVEVATEYTLKLIPVNAPSGFRLQIAPLDVIQAVMAGIGFLGAGTIFMARQNTHVKGLTTAASIWVTAAIGLTVGFSRYALAIGATLLILFVLHVMPRIMPTNRQHAPGDDQEA